MRLMSAKLHRVKVTEADRDYVGSLTVDRDLLDKAGILPLEVVEVVNLESGDRWTTYAIPGEPGSGQICSNGGCALLSKPGDLLIVWTLETKEREEVLKHGHSARVVFVDEANRCCEVEQQILVPAGGTMRLDRIAVSESALLES